MRRDQGVGETVGGGDWVGGGVSGHGSDSPGTSRHGVGVGGDVGVPDGSGVSVGDGAGDVVASGAGVAVGRVASSRGVSRFCNHRTATAEIAATTRNAASAGNQR